MEKLKAKLQSIDGKGYKAYKSILGTYQFDNFTCRIDHVQGDPFATASRISLMVTDKMAAIPHEVWHNQIRKVAAEDFLSRQIARSIGRYVKGRRGTGNSGVMRISTSGQQVLLRNNVLLSENGVEARIEFGLPASGRSVLAKEASAMFFEELPNVVEHGLFFARLNRNAFLAHVDSVEDQAALRSQLDQQNCVAFIANGACLPRASGVDDRPLQEQVVSFQSPTSLEQTFDTPNGGQVSGMAIPAGVTLIVGGGFHGKSTLLHAIERGVYDHILDDGREKVATCETAVKVRAEDGRSISAVDISPFIDRLPFGRDTKCFTTNNASGSTSQAANIMEALNCGARLLLIDEDTSATNFMIRDERMQSLVRGEKEPITPLLHRVRELYEQHGISSIIVMGGSGDYFDVADTVIMLDEYQARDVTDQAARLADKQRKFEHYNDNPIYLHSSRRPGKRVLDPSRGKKESKIDSKRTHYLLYGEHEVDLGRVEQLVDIGQTRSIGLIMKYLFDQELYKQDDLTSALQGVFERIDKQGLDFLSPYIVGYLALPRLYEVAAAINRIREGKWFDV